MQILSPALRAGVSDGGIINIHHSFLPAFAAPTPTAPRTTAA
jgi:formyltetrahydrofolate hydrolase